MSENKRQHTAKIIEYGKEMSAPMRISMKDISDGRNINEELDFIEAAGQKILALELENYALVAVHNEQATDNQDYENLIFLTKEGEKYYTSSESCKTKFFDMVDELKEDGVSFDTVRFKFFHKESKNKSNKPFITCTCE